MSTLYVVPTPIGNLEDMTFRAVRLLKEVDVILAEDTRITSRLLRHYGIDTPLQSHHMHNEHRKARSEARAIAGGRKTALVSDAGTPAISDPGFMLVRACVEEGVRVECLPGSSALLPALVNSGIPCDRFYFEGFLPAKKGRKKRLEEIAQLPHTVVIFESPYKLLKTLEGLREFAGDDRRVSVSREISKMHEETARGSLKEVMGYFEDKGVKGEFVIVLAGRL